MTWKQFKEAVEAGGVTDDMRIWFIDVTFPSKISVCPENEGTEHPNRVGLSVTD